MTQRTKDKMARRTCSRCKAGRAKARGLCGACFSASVRRSSITTLIVGMAPGNGTAHDGPAFVGSKSGRFLAELCGTVDVTLPTRFTLVNMFVDEWQHGGREAKRVAGDIVRDVIFEKHNLVVLCGRAVGNAFKFEGGWFEYEQRRVLVNGRWWSYDRLLIPHPSGLCRLWNDEDNREKGRTIMSKIWEDAG